jgi:hypothetical protein
MSSMPKRDIQINVKTSLTPAQYLVNEVHEAGVTFASDPDHALTTLLALSMEEKYASIEYADSDIARMKDNSRFHSLPFTRQMHNTL